MTTQADEYLSTANSLSENAEIVLKKCSEHPALKADSFDTIARIRRQAGTAFREARDIVSSFNDYSTGKAQKAKKRVEEARKNASNLVTNLDRVRRAIADAQTALSSHEEHLKISGAVVEQDRVAAEKRRELEELRQKEAELSTALRGVELNDLPSRDKELAEATDEQEDEKRERWEHYRHRLRDQEVQLRSVVDQANSLFNWLEAAHQLQQAVRVDFQTKAQDFEKAETFHKREARLMLWVMSVIALLASLAIYFLFVSADNSKSSQSVNTTTPASTEQPPRDTLPTVSPPGSSSASTSNATGTTSPAAPTAPVTVVPDFHPPPSTPSGASETVRIIEHALLLATGRIALLLLSAWAFKYVADLHRAHAEQSVIYRDRLAALGVAQTMLNATDSLEHKQNVLKLLADGYLNFEQSAFRVPRSSDATQETTRDAAVDRQIKHVKDAVEAVRPLFDAVGKVADKAK